MCSEYIEKLRGFKIDGLVSIIIPVYNTGMIINRCINSILNSEYKNIEIIIVDDGSDNKFHQEIQEAKKFKGKTMSVQGK